MADHIGISTAYYVNELSSKVSPRAKEIDMCICAKHTELDQNDE